MGSTYRATPFCTTTLPECKCLKGGNPFSLRKSRPSSICLPNLATCHDGKPVPVVPYFREYSSFQVLCRNNCKIYFLHITFQWRIYKLIISINFGITVNLLSHRLNLCKSLKPNNNWNHTYRLMTSNAARLSFKYLDKTYVKRTVPDKWQR